ncbi:uncharacterized protein NEMAJ01_0169 [Nematocida major]|uniref:uncharacterized protein n=1 Tax=Nematocida major TaxID=1912982 RepID=UPI002007A7E6|nr:uncharacterized protein NEMAJ01_0169 [Nematocida major]KAH9385273.1 hypothetical protein NEMAJ01_0169 [Nematocida major]
MVERELRKGTAHHSGSTEDQERSLHLCMPGSICSSNEHAQMHSDANKRIGEIIEKLKKMASKMNENAKQQAGSDIPRRHSTGHSARDAFSLSERTESLGHADAGYAGLLECASKGVLSLEMEPKYIQSAPKHVPAKEMETCALQAQINEMVERSPSFIQIKSALEHLIALLAPQAKGAGEARVPEKKQNAAPKEPSGHMATRLVCQNMVEKIRETLLAKSAQKDNREELANTLKNEVGAHRAAKKAESSARGGNTRAPQKKAAPTRAAEKTARMQKLFGQGPHMFSFFRVTNLPRKGQSVDEIEEAWRAATELESFEIGLIFMLEETEAQLVVSDQKVSEMKKILNVYKEQSKDVKIQGPLKNPLAHERHSEAWLLRCIRTKAEQFLQSEVLRGTGLYRLCQMAQRCAGTLEFKQSLSEEKHERR